MKEEDLVRLMDAYMECEGYSAIWINWWMNLRKARHSQKSFGHK